jgi:mannose-6-phosphate isomerase
MHPPINFFYRTFEPYSSIPKTLPMESLYPLKFTPVFKEKIWGGQKIRTRVGLDFSPLPNCGEAWVLSGVPGSETIVSNGFLEGNSLNELLEIYMDELVGEKVFDDHNEEFPILIKFIDSNEWLSIQVHPDDELARQRGLLNGKSEMWYVMEAEPGAELITGFNKETDRQGYIELLREKRLKEVLNREKASTGDVFYMPAGRVHAMGPGILIAEIQQTSDTTYRIYDWDRTDEKGNSRELHTDLALDAIDFNVRDSYRSRYKPVQNQAAAMVHSPFFSTNMVLFNEPMHREYGLLDSFVVHLCVEGSYRMEFEGGSEMVKKGEAVLIPAVIPDVRMVPEGQAEVIEIYMP